MDSELFVKEFNRMCNTYRFRACYQCKLPEHDKSMCAAWVMEHPNESIELIKDWSETHPAKTNREKFVEIFGDIKLYSDWWEEPYEEITVEDPVKTRAEKFEKVFGAPLVYSTCPPRDQLCDDGLCFDGDICLKCRKWWEEIYE